MAFVKFTKVRSRIDTPKASIWTRGQIGFNQGAVKEYNLDAFQYAVLYYDENSQRIGIKLINDPKADGAIKLVSRENAGISFSATAFFKNYKIDFSETRQYTLTYDDENNMYIFNLKNPL